MPRLTIEELNEARRRSGNLGGRPRKPTRDEAREKALDELTPQALAVLKVHLGDPDNPNPMGGVPRCVCSSMRSDGLRIT
jgi:hypothetical protein